MSNSPNGSTHSSSGRENPTGSANSTRVRRRNSRESPMAFYEIPPWVDNVPTKIINNAKQSLREIPTTRPYTPRDESRFTLAKLNHEPSGFSATSVDYDVESRPSSSKPVDPLRRNSKGISDGSTPVNIPPPRLSKLQHSSSKNQQTNSKNDDNASVPTKPPIPTANQHRSTTSATSTTSKSSQNRTGSASNKDESSEESTIWKHEIQPLIDTMTTAYQKKHYDQYDETSRHLYDALLKYGLFNKKSSKRRGELLKTLFNFIESESSIVKFHVARLSLAFQISSPNNLRNIIRVIAELSSNKDNDSLFLNTNILDLLFQSILRIDVAQNLESVGYFCKTLKNLTVNNELICFISEKKPFDLFKTILKNLLELRDQTQYLQQLDECLTPLTDALRNLADNDLNRREFLSDDLMSQLTLILKHFTDKSYEDLMKNIARLFSKLTQHTDCCLKLVQYSSCYRSFLKVLVKHESNQALVVRVCFILGNMMAKSEDARKTFMKDSHALQALVKLLHSYIQLDSLILRPEKLDNDDSLNQDLDVGDETNVNQFRSIENVINKVIRVLSNLAISEENGLLIIRRDDCIDLLFKLLKAPKQHSEELLVHVLMALNNLSYYDDPQSYINRNCETLTHLLVKYIRNEERMDCVVEAFRVLGNLSRLEKIRDILMKYEVDRAVIHHCESDNVELLYAVIGVLINLTVDEDKRICLKNHKGIDSLINIFDYSIQSDWQLSSLVCKALWNYCDNNFEKSDNQPLWFTADQLTRLIDLFNESLNESDLEVTGDNDMDELNKQLWKEEYFPVASRLYQRIIEGNEHFHTIQINERS